MKRFSTLLICFLALHALNAQSERAVRGNGNVITKDIQTGNYDKISVDSDIDVVLVAGKEGNIQIEAESNLMDMIVVETEGDELKIHQKKGKYVKHAEKIRITVPFERISEISSAGSGDVKSKSPIKTNNFKVNLAGSGNVHLTVEASDVKADLAGSGDIKLSGNVTDFNCSVAGSGDINAEELKSQNVNASVAGSGNISVYSNDSVKGNISGSGDIKYKGNATKITKSIVGSGSVSKM